MLLGCLFSFLQKVSGQQTLYECIKNYFFKICCSHPCFKKNQVQKIKLSWIPKCLPSIYFIKFLSLLKNLSLFFFSIFFIFYLSLIFFFFFFKQARTDTFLKQGYSFGWLELEAWRYAISPTLELLCESKCAMSGSPFECISTPKSIKVFSWCSPYVLRHHMSPVLLNRHLKWLGPRIPEGAYYA